MPFSGVVFANVSGAETAAPGQIVQSTVWNNIHTDYGTALTQLMSQVTTLISNRNLLEANGSADVWQRGAGNTASIAVAASTTAYTTDRWYIVTGANQASVIAATTPLSDESFLSANILRNAGQTGTTALTFGYPFGARELARILGNKD